MRRHAALLLICVATISCRSVSPAGSRAIDPADDVRAVETALRAWYDASERHDSTTYVAQMLPEFFILEDTTHYDRATLARLVAASFPAGTDRATLSDFSTQISGDVAWSTFRNAEVFTPAGAAALPVRRFVETAIFRRVNGQWKLARYHATRINRPAPAP
jgi:ketosteroid isomerase-like protein